MSPLSHTVCTLVLLFVAFTARVGWASAQDAQNVGAVARVTQVDTSKFPVINVSVSVTDGKGKPVYGDQNAKLVLREDGREVSNAKPSKGYSVSSVLVLDVSGSMYGEKLRQAKLAAIEYINQSEPNHQIAIVSFSDKAFVLSGFTDDKEQLRNQVQGLSARGQTALQDAIGKGLDLLKSRTDRKSMLVLTDGYENASTAYTEDSGRQTLIERAKREECSISTIGLGDRIDTALLQSFEETHGKYLSSPDASQLSSIFGQSLSQLQKEYVFTYTTQNPDPDGTRRAITVELQGIAGQAPSATPFVATVPGLLPHVSGDHTAYLIVLLVMLVIPVGAPFLASLLSVYRFRKAYMVKVGFGSSYIGQMDPNDSPAEKFVEGDVLIICPISDTPHHVQCWRLNKCRCFRDSGERHFCYHRTFPKWVRRSLDYLFAQRRGETGRTWLCHCAGDQQGY
jgi:VWFA-related protein